MALVFDLMLATGLIATGASAVLTGRDVRAAVLVVAFGLLMALTWVRLDAPDIALAEAAVGAGVTGVLLLDAALVLRHGGPDAEEGER